MGKLSISKDKLKELLIEAYKKGQQDALKNVNRFESKKELNIGGEKFNFRSTVCKELK
jgi:hypothetical protein